MMRTNPVAALATGFVFSSGGSLGEGRDLVNSVRHASPLVTVVLRSQLRVVLSLGELS